MNSWSKNLSGAMGSFTAHKGWHIFTSSLIVKLLNFALILVAVRLVSPKDFNDFSYAQSVLAFLLPLAGMGLNHSLLRYGGLLQSLTEKQELYKISLKKGVLITILLMAILIKTANLITHHLPGANLLLLILSAQLISTFLLEMIKAFFRIHHLNRAYALVEVQFAFILFTTAIIGIYFFGISGLCVAYAISGSLLFLYWKLRRKNLTSIKLIKNNSLPSGYVKYGFYAGIGGVASALMYQVDILTIGNLLLDETSVAIYKVATHLPYSIIFISLAYVHAQYVSLTKNYENKSSLILFLKQYYAIFIPLGLVLYVLVYFLAPWLINMFYGADYVSAVEPLRILFLGLLAIFWFRVPFGNLLGAVGKSKWNAIISIFMILGNIILNYYLVTQYGLIGASWATTILLLLSGLVSMIFFIHYLRKL
ncbi:MAG: O-antigen/teichoic acid export membrane protein [Flavobacteriales bacterium]|jgi:O-antigen/teichoic acid export membrane protein